MNKAWAGAPGNVLVEAKEMVEMWCFEADRTTVNSTCKFPR